MLTKSLGRPKNRWKDDIRNDMKKLKIKNWTDCIQDRNNWKLYVEWAKQSAIGVVGPEEEGGGEEEEEEEGEEEEGEEEEGEEEGRGGEEEEFLLYHGKNGYANASR
jgi:hypothetical protein